MYLTFSGDALHIGFYFSCLLYTSPVVCVISTSGLQFKCNDHFAYFSFLPLQRCIHLHTISCLFTTVTRSHVPVLFGYKYHGSKEKMGKICVFFRLKIPVYMPVLKKTRLYWYSCIKFLKANAF